MPKSGSQLQRQFSLYVLLGTVILVGVLFFRVMQPFLMPLILGAVLALLFRPFHEWCTRRLGDRRNIAAGLVTVSILIACLVPIGGALILAVRELADVGRELTRNDWRDHPVVADILRFVDHNVTDEQWEEWRQSSTGTIESITSGLYDQTTGLLANAVGFVVGLCIALLSVFYFLAEGPALVRAVQRVSPLENEDELELFQEFERVCRGVILATLVCALAQAVLAGIGFAVLGIPHFWLLAGLTMFTSMIPFIGAAAVWIGVSLWLVLTGEYASATILAIYGTVIISTVDNLIRAYVLHGTARLHPLIALLSVLGALQTIGLWGIFVGPLVAAFFYALLKILHKRVNSFDTVASST